MSHMAQTVHNARFKVKSICTVDPCFLHNMTYDDRPEAAIRLQQAREKRGFKSARDAANFFGWSYDTYVQHENGTRGITRMADRYATAFHVSQAWLLTGEGLQENEAEVPLMGYIGAGAEIMPEFEQVPEEGLEQIWVPFPLPAEMIAFGVRGDSMLPVYKDGAVIICYKERKRPIEAFYGEDAAVRTEDGRRFLKTIMRGSDSHVNLFSWNAAPIENVRLEWVGEIFAVLPPKVLRNVDKQGGIQASLPLPATVRKRG
jgi:hypothetical protein